MARTKIPDPLSRRHLLEGGIEPQKALSLAELYLSETREVEAVDFLSQALSGEGAPAEAARGILADLQGRALERGDVFLMRAASSALGEEPTAARWRELAEAATRAGREQDAETAQRLATVEG